MRFYHEILRQADLDSPVVAVFIFPNEHARNEIRHTAEIVFIRQNEQHTVVVFPSERFLRNARSKPFYIVASYRFVVLIRRAANRLSELFRRKRNDFFVVAAAFEKINFRVISYGQFIAKFLRITLQVRNLPRRFYFVVEHKVGKARILAVFGHSEHAAHARPFNKRVARHLDFRIADFRFYICGILFLSPLFRRFLRFKAVSALLPIARFGVVADCHNVVFV